MKDQEKKLDDKKTKEIVNEYLADKNKKNLLVYLSESTDYTLDQLCELLDYTKESDNGEY